MRHMIFMFTTTYAESVISTPNLEYGELSGPMQYGITYMVRPSMHPLNSPISFFFTLHRISLIVRRTSVCAVSGADKRLLLNMCYIRRV